MAKQHYAIAMDIGGTNVRAALISAQGKILHSCKMEAVTTGGRAVFLKTVVAAAQEVLDYAKRSAKIDTKSIVGIGMSMSGFVDKQGKFVFAPNYPLTGFNIRQFMSKKFSLPVFVENDANCFALAEAHFGAAKGKSHVVGLIIGTGIGAGIVIDGKIYPGACGGAGEIGHTMLVVEDPIRKAQFSKDVEYYASGKKVIDRYHRLGGKSPDMKVYMLPKAKEPLAQQIYEETYILWGMLLGNIINILNPEMIVIGGGLSPDIDYAKVRACAQKFSIPVLGKACKIVPQKLGDTSGALGAAALVFRHL